jgi:hypothetical protein
VIVRRGERIIVNKKGKRVIVRRGERIIVNKERE